MRQDLKNIFAIFSTSHDKGFFLLTQTVKRDLEKSSKIFFLGGLMEICLSVYADNVSS